VLGLNFLLAASLSHGQSVQSPETAATAASEEDGDVIELAAFTVMSGTNIRGVEQSTGSVVIGMTRADIQATGPATTEELLKVNPAMGNFQALFPGNGDAGGSYLPSIHGLGEGQTLVLINGHRLPGSGWLATGADPSAIPPSALQQVDIIPDGASAIYGSDAIEGVINLILRKDFNGVETTARYGFGDHYNTLNLSGLFGRTWNRGSLLVAYEYQKISNLKGRDRSEFYTQDLRPLGGGDFRSQNAYPANIVVDGTTYALPGFDTSSPNLFDVAPYFDIVPELKRHNVVVALNQQLTDKVSVFAEAYYTKRDSRQEVPPDSISVAVPNTNPYFIAPPGSNATSVTAQYNLTNDLGVLTNTTSSELYSFVVGGRVDLGHDWSAALDITHGWSDGQRFQPIINQAAAAQAAQGTTTATALNPFGVGPVTAPQVLALLPTSVNVAPDTTQDLTDVVLKFDGPLFSAPGGEAKMAAGVAYREENYESTSRSGALANPLVGRADVGRDARSVFSEILIPFVGKDNASPGLQRLDLSVSARYDDYSDFGSTTNPKIGATWSPVKGLDLRGSYGTSFHAPRLSDLGTGVDTRLIPLPFYFLGGVLPRGATTAPSNSVIIAGGSENLQAEEATSWSAGFDFKPEGLPGLKFTATYYDVQFENKVDVVFAPDFNNPGDDRYWLLNPTPEQVAEIFAGVPLPPGAVLPDPIEYIADVRRYNLGTVWTSGIDFDLGYRWQTGGGHVEAGLGGNWITEYRVQPSAGSAISSRLDTENAVRPKLRGRLSWYRRPFNAALFVNRTDGYFHRGTGRRVSAWTTVDFHVSCDLSGNKWLEGTQLILDVSNLFDEKPPFVNLSQINNGDGTGIFGFDRLNASPLGRVVSLSVRKKW